MKFLGLTQNEKDVTNKSYVTQVVETEGGKINTISVDGVQQEIVNKNVNINLTGKADKTAVPVKSITSANGEALLWNEASGGGAKFTNVNGVESFVGVNDGANDIVAQIYADKYVDGKWQGAKLDVANTGIFYTVGNKTATERMVDANELATVGKIADLATYTIDEVTATEGYSASYELKNNGVVCGARINIPKSMIVKSASVKTCTEDDVPVEGYRVGDKYIDLVLNTASGDEHVYILVKELVDVYKAGQGIEISNLNVISAKVNAANGLSLGVNGIQLGLASQLNSGAMSAVDFNKLAAIQAGSERNFINSVNSDLFSVDENRELTSAKLSSISNEANKVEASTNNGFIKVDGAETKVYEFPGMSYNDLTDKPLIPSVPTNVSAFTNDAGYLTEHQSLTAYRTASDQNIIDAGKQASIADLDVIRSGAALGATALQSVPSTYRTAAEQDAIHDTTKQDKLTAGTNITITDNVISASGTSYTAGNGIDINDNTISTKLGSGLKHTDDGKITLNTADSTINVGEFGVRVPYVSTSLDNTANGLAVKLADNTIEAYNSGTGTKGLRVNQNVIQPKLTAGTNVQITGNTISATDTVYDDTAIKALIDNKANASDLSSHTSNLDIHVTSAKKSEWDAKATVEMIPTDLADLAEDTEHQLVTSTEKTTWNAANKIASAINVTQTVGGYAAGDVINAGTTIEEILRTLLSGSSK